MQFGSKRKGFGGWWQSSAFRARVVPLADSVTKVTDRAQDLICGAARAAIMALDTPQPAEKTITTRRNGRRPADGVCFGVAVPAKPARPRRAKRMVVTVDKPTPMILVFFHGEVGWPNIIQAASTSPDPDPSRE